MRFRLLIGTGVVTVFVLTGTIYGFTYGKVGRVTTAENFRRLLSRKILKIATSDCKNAMLELIGKTLTSNDFRNRPSLVCCHWMVRLLLAGVVSTVSGIYREVALHTIWSFRLDLCHCDSPDGQACSADKTIKLWNLRVSHSKPFLVMQIQFGRSPSMGRRLLAAVRIRQSSCGTCVMERCSKLFLVIWTGFFCCVQPWWANPC